MAELLPVADWEHEAPAVVALPLARLAACALAPAHAEFRVRDWGRWQEPRAERESRGIIMMRALTDDCAINHLTDGTEVILRFAL